MESRAREILWSYGAAYWREWKQAQQAQAEDDGSRAGEPAGAGTPRGAESEAEGDGTRVNAFAGGMMYEVGDGALLGDGEGRGRIMFVLHVWVHSGLRRQHWATEAMLREARRRRAVEVHLIATNEGAKAAYRAMGMRVATEEQVARDVVSERPDARRGEAYMHGPVDEMVDRATARGVEVSETRGRQLIRKTRLTQRGGGVV